jgi:nitroreductase
MEFIDVIKTRRSVRKFKDQEIEPEKLERMLECARWSPSWANKQCWHFVAVSDREMIKKVSQTSMINKWLKTAPAIIVACADPKASGERNGIDYFTVDTAIAMEHLVLAAADQGLGTCWIGAFNEDKLKEILGIPENIRLVALTPVGYPMDNPGLGEIVTRSIIGSKKRKPLDEFVHHDGW